MSTELTPITSGNTGATTQHHSLRIAAPSPKYWRCAGDNWGGMRYAVQRPGREKLLAMSSNGVEAEWVTPEAVFPSYTKLGWLVPSDQAECEALLKPKEVYPKYWKCARDGWGTWVCVYKSDPDSPLYYTDKTGNSDYWTATVDSVFPSYVDEGLLVESTLKECLGLYAVAHARMTQVTERTKLLEDLLREWIGDARTRRSEWAYASCNEDCGCLFKRTERALQGKS